MKRVCWDIIIHEALCSMGKKVCYINYFHQQNLGCYLSKNLFVHAIKGKPDKMSVIYWPLSDDSIMDSGTWQNKTVVKFFLGDVHWLDLISAISRVRSLIPLGGWGWAHFPEQRLVIEPGTDQLIMLLALYNSFTVYNYLKVYYFQWKVGIQQKLFFNAWLNLWT